MHTRESIEALRREEKEFLDRAKELRSRISAMEVENSMESLGVKFGDKLSRTVSSGWGKNVKSNVQTIVLKGHRGGWLFGVVVKKDGSEGTREVVIYSQEAWKKVE